MFDISFTELLIIGVIALVVIGPERLPKVAKTLGHLIGRAQRYVSDVKSDIQREVELDELRKLKDQMQEAAQSVQSSLQNTEAAMREPLEAFEQSTMSTLNELKTPLGAPEPSTPEPSTPELSTPETPPDLPTSVPTQLDLDVVRSTSPNTIVPSADAATPEISPGLKSS